MSKKNEPMPLGLNILEEVEQKTIPPEVVVPTQLTPEQELLILKIWNERKDNPPSLKELVSTIFGPQFDGRDKRARLIKEFLVARSGEKIRTAPIPTPETILTEEQKEFVANNVSTSNYIQMAEELFGKKLHQSSSEVRAIINYAKTLSDRVKLVPPEYFVEKAHVSPKSDTTMIDKINKYVDEPIDKTKYGNNDKQKRWVQKMIDYVNSYRYIQQINTYQLQADRELFESSFISYTYQKDDLTPEERDQYIILCSEIVISKNIQESIERFQRLADEAAEGSSDDRRSVSMSLVEMISSMRKEYNDCVKRQQSLINDLKVKRSVRVQEKIQQDESLVVLLDFWRSFEKRKLLTMAAIERKKKVKEEIKRLESMDELKAQIFGIDADEVLNS